MTDVERDDTSGPTIEIPREILVEADSMLSWIWHRHLSNEVRRAEQQRYDRIISALRNAYEKHRR